ncbi:MAG: hypothetical protein D6761_09675 [Candidatus Dadabacteria bacterium]|nr:MAG: hypothetical protein D6761_09675 [Candidatus Dadabacteria bacterium]
MRRIIVCIWSVAACVALSGPPREAACAVLPADTLIESEADLARLLANGTIDVDTADALAALLDDPIDLNHASRQRLEQLPGVDASLADTILALRQRESVDLDMLVRNGILSATEIARLRPFVITRSHITSWQLSQEARASLVELDIPAAWQRIRLTDGRGLPEAGLLWQLQRTTWHNVRSDGLDVIVAPPPVQPRPIRYGIETAWRDLRLIFGTWAVRHGEGLTLAVGHPRRDAFGLELGIRPGWAEVSDCRHACRGNILADAAPATARRGGVLSWSRGRAALSLFASDSVERIPSWGVRNGSDGATSVTFWQQNANGTPIELQRSLPLMREQLVGLSGQVQSASLRAGCAFWAARPRWRVSPALALTVAAPFPAANGWGASGCWAEAAEKRFEAAGELATTITRETGAAGVLRIEGKDASGWALWLWHYGDRWDNPHSGAPASPLLMDGARGRGESGVRAQVRHKRRLRTTARTELAWQRPTNRWRVDSRLTLAADRHAWPWVAGYETRLLAVPGEPSEWRITPLARVAPAGAACLFEARWAIEQDPGRTQTPSGIVSCSTAAGRSYRLTARLSAEITIPDRRQAYGVRLPFRFSRRGYRIQVGPTLDLFVDAKVSVQAWVALRWDWRPSSARVANAQDGSAGDERRLNEND